MAVKFGFNMPLSAIVAGITANKKAGETVQDRWHKLAVSVLAHLQSNGDWDTAVRLANDVVDGLGNGSRRNVMRSWFLSGGDKTVRDGHGPFAYNQETKLLVRNFNFQHKNIGVKTAIASPWYDFAPEADYQPMDFQKTLAALIKRAEKDIKELGDASKVDRKLLAILKGDTSVNQQSASVPDAPAEGAAVTTLDARDAS